MSQRLVAVVTSGGLWISAAGMATLAALSGTWPVIGLAALTGIIALAVTVVWVWELRREDPSRH